MDAFKRQIHGIRDGRTCPCCSDIDKRTAARIARARLVQADRRLWGRA